MQQEFRVGDIRPNPYRHVERYPMNAEKVKALEESFDRTGFWDNIVVRINAKGKPEAAYGHHRLAALKKKYGPDHRTSFIVKEFDEESMLRAMADENMQEWSASATVVVETVRAVRDFLVSGPARKRGGPNGEKPGSAVAISAFLGWPTSRVEDAVAILNAEEAGVLRPEDTKGLGIEQATVMRSSVQRIRDPKVRRTAINRVRQGLTSGEIGKRGIRDTVDQVRQQAKPAPAVEPVIPKEVIRGVANQFATLADAVRNLNDLLIAHPEAAGFVRDATGRLGHLMPHYLANMMVRFDPEYQMLVEVVVNGQPPEARPVALTSPTAPASAKVVS